MQTDERQLQSHNKNNYKYPVIVFIIADGNNKGYCVAYGLVRDEDIEHFNCLLNEFKTKNYPVEIITIVIDRAMAEVSAVKQFFLKLTSFVGTM